MNENSRFGKGRFGGNLTFHSEIVNGVCPSCSSETIFVSLFKNLYRCTGCGHDLEQKVNGAIQYIPISAPGGTVPIIKYVEDGPQKN